MTSGPYLADGGPGRLFTTRLLTAWIDHGQRVDDPGPRFQIVDEIRAGDWKPRFLNLGEAVRIATGGALPGEPASGNGSSELQVVMKEDGKDANRMNEFAWLIMTADGLVQRDYPLALRAARRAITSGSR